MKIFSDPQGQVSNLEGGAIDVAVNINLTDAARLQNDPKYSLILNRNSGGYYEMQANTTLPPTDNKTFRQALQYAVDRQRIVDSVLLKLGDPLELPWYPTSPAFDAARNKTYSFDLDKARSLLQQSGVGNVSIDFNVSTAIPEFSQMGQILQADLAKIGLTLNLKPMQPAGWSAITYSAKYNGVSAGTGLFGQEWPGLQYGSPVFGPNNNWSGLKSDQFTKVATDMSSAVDPVKAKAAYDAYNDYVLDQSFAIVIASALQRCVTTKRVHGVAYDMAYDLDATAAWLG
jgi:peptide/nickel transport system substrate-binding protein